MSTVAALRAFAVEELRRRVGRALDGPDVGSSRACLVIDADRTLAVQDTGRLVGKALGVDLAIRGIFDAHGYIEPAFAAVSTAWAAVQADVYLACIAQVSTTVELRPAWRTILSARGRAPVFVITAGIPQAWRRVLDRDGFADVPVIGGCHAAIDDHVVCPESKAALVELLQAAGWIVLAAGDGPIDLPMLELADVPLFVPDHRDSLRLREQLHRVPRIRHLVVDDRRFDGLPTCTADDVVSFLNTGVWCHAD